jgi:hypothetical protein
LYKDRRRRRPPLADGRDLLLELDSSRLRLLRPSDVDRDGEGGEPVVIHEEKISDIRCWGVGGTGGGGGGGSARWVTKFGVICGNLMPY